MSNLSKYDFVIYGATGFTGKLVVEYAINQYNNNDEISWAIAGRNNEKLEHIQEKYNLPSEIGKIVRASSNISTVAITGSSGKTSLKEMLGRMMNKICQTSYSKKSFNNKYGVPISLFNINKEDKIGIFEVGMDKKGEIDFLTKKIMPNVAVITNISYAHIKNFKNLKGIASAKSEIILCMKPGSPHRST